MSNQTRTELHEAFEAAYRALNKKQREAVDSIDGPVMVIAGPGTGKTQILTLRIANILKQTDVQPEQILALTFTKSGAAAMRNRLRQFIGVAAYRVPIFTFHSFCERLISVYPEYYERIIGSKALTDIEQIEILERILAMPEARLLRPVNAPDYYIKSLIATIGTMKQEAVSPDHLASIIAEEIRFLDSIEQFHTKGAHKGKERSEYTKYQDKIAKQQVLLFVYRHYETVLREQRRYDFNDMILETASVLTQHESVRLDVQETYQYVLADEHQDVNGAQNNILSLLTSYHDNPNLFVVGDEKQAIYRFQGASLENFLFFEKTFPRTKVIALTENYRSTQTILDAAHALIAVTEGPLVDYRIPLIAAGQKTDHGILSLTEYSHELHEHERVLSLVRDMLATGTPPDQVAIIVRSNREVEVFATLLRTAGIAVNPSADGDILRHPIFLALLDLLTVITEPTNEVALAAIIQAPYIGISTSDAALLLRHVSYHQPLTACLFAAEVRQTIPFQKPETIERFVQALASVQSLRLTDAPHRVLATAIEELGFLEHMMAGDAGETARVIRRFYDEVEALVINGEIDSLVSLVALLRRRIAYGVPLTVPYIPDGLAAVAVMTAHKAKGLEFDVVIVPHLTDLAWGGKNHRDTFKVPLLKTAELELSVNEDERRLLYVAMTRARRQLYLSYSTLTKDGKEALLSPLCAANDLLVPQIHDIADPVNLTNFAVHKSPSLRWVEDLLIRNLHDRGLSVTALNNIIKNPWHYFFRNVIRLPEMQNPALQFGTAMHAVMEYVTKTHTATGALPSFTAVRDRLAYSLGRLPLTTTEYTSLFEKGLVALPLHLELLEQTLPKNTFEELSIRVTVTGMHPSLTEMQLHGKIDRVDFAEDGSAVCVIDYKTGKPKTRNAIEGKTKDGDASYRRQLTFYALLLNLHNDERFYTPEGTLQFLEPDSKGVLKSESFTSDETAQMMLQDLIKDTLASLVTAKFVMDDELLATSDYERLGRLWRDRMLVD